MRPRNSREPLLAERESVMPSPASAAQPQWPGTDPNRPSRAGAFASARGLKVPVIASPGEILRAREIREQLRKIYLDRPVRTLAPWCVGID